MRADDQASLATRRGTGDGLDARTVARLGIDLEHGPLVAGTVFVLDEVSQTPTAEIEAVLAAVDARPRRQRVGCSAIPANPNQSVRAESPTTSKSSQPAG